MQKVMSIQLTAENQHERDLLKEIANRIKPGQAKGPIDILRLEGGEYLAKAWPLISKDPKVLLTDARTSQPTEG